MSEVLLPLPRRLTSVSVEEAILLRRSIRSYTRDPITLEQLSMILWAAQGVTETGWRLRASPSAGATYPLEVYVVIGRERVRGSSGGFLEPGVYRYSVYRHSLAPVRAGDYRAELARAALDQGWVREAAVDIVLCGVYERTTSRYGDRGVRYVHIEVGHAAENIHLMAAALGLGSVAVGAFYDHEVAEVIGARPGEHPLYIIPVGVPKKPYTAGFSEVAAFYEGIRR